ncbi:MAG TPA: Hsp20/alpha crystallin family protein [Vicinamibacterales bacterium]|nr:Hsp20/alpha crystallin family protein [Vicinamibacterales bacterium]
MLYATATTRSAPVFGLRREIDKLFEDTFGRGPTGQHAWIPAVDVCETDKELTFVVELPGMNAEEVDVSALDGVLTIQGERVDERTVGQDERYHLLERNYGSFLRRFQLPPGLDGEKILADVANGVLRVHVPKSAVSKPRNVHVTAGTGATSPAPQSLNGGSNAAAPAAMAVQSRQSD